MPDMFLINFEIPFIIYAILVFVGFIISVLGILGIASIYHFGKPMAPFMWVRLKRWKNNNLALLESIDVTGNIDLEEVTEETGAYRLNTPSAPLLLPKSVYVINTIPTIPALNLYPKLHKDIITGIQALIDAGINTFTALEKAVTDNPTDPLFEGYTYESFKELYVKTQEKYRFKVTVRDVAEVVGGNFNKSFVKSIVSSDYNKMNKSQNNPDHVKYGAVALILAVIFAGAVIVYKVVYGGG